MSVGIEALFTSALGLQVLVHGEKYSDETVQVESSNFLSRSRCSGALKNPSS